MHPVGQRLRQMRERLGLTYREVQRASCEIASRRGRPDFILHISRLADIENRGVVPSLHKLYSMAVIYHLDPIELAKWYEAPLGQTLEEGLQFPAPKTHLGESYLRTSQFGPEEKLPDFANTELLRDVPEGLKAFSSRCEQGKYRCGFIGLGDRRMAPVLNPGSTVLIDTEMRKVEDREWKSEFDRPMYFVELRQGYRCGWFVRQRSRLILQPHPLSRCIPEAWRIPNDAEVVGQVVGIVSYMGERGSRKAAGAPEGQPDLSERVP